MVADKPRGSEDFGFFVCFFCLLSFSFVRGECCFRFDLGVALPSPLAPDLQSPAPLPALSSDKRFALLGSFRPSFPPSSDMATAVFRAPHTTSNYQLDGLPLAYTPTCPESALDFVMPVKEVGPVLRAVVEGVMQYYQPRSIVFVAPETVLGHLVLLLPLWKMQGVPVRLQSEENLFSPLGLSRDMIESEFEAAKSRRAPGFFVKNVDDREFGWWYQQLIKLGAGTLIPGISETYVVWDSDLIPVKRWPIVCPVVQKGKSTVMTKVAILQGASKSTEAFDQYGEAMQYLLGITPMHPVGGGTFVTHHMPFHKEVVTNMLEEMSGDGPWPLKIVQIVEKTKRFSEYLTYASYAQCNGDTFHYHCFNTYGKGGERWRGGGNALDGLLSSNAVTRVPRGGFSFSQAIKYARDTFDENLPYLQFDHLYTTIEYLDIDPSIAKSSGPSN